MGAGGLGIELPECIRKSLGKDNHQRTLDMRQLLRRHRCGRYGPWLDRLRTIERLARVPFPRPVNLFESGNYDSAPLPSLVVVFKENDAIAACFDEEGQYMLEGSPEPSLPVAFSPRESNEVRDAIRVVSRFIRINAELFQLVEELQG